MKLSWYIAISKLVVDSIEQMLLLLSAHVEFMCIGEFQVQEVIGEQVYVMKRINLCNANDEGGLDICKNGLFIKCLHEARE